MASSREGNASNSIEVSNIPDTTQDGLTLFFEDERSSGGGQIKSLLYDKEKRTAIIVYAHCEDAERVLQKTQHVYNRFLVTVAALDVPTHDRICRTIQVRGYVGGPDTALFPLYFKNKRRSGGDEIEQHVFRADENVHYITFQSAAVVHRVLEKAPHYIDKKLLDVKAMGHTETDSVVGGQSTVDQTTLARAQSGCGQTEMTTHSGQHTAGLQAKMKDRLTCEVCFLEYNQSERAPKMLDCHHSFCKSCIQSLIEATFDKSSFPCPTCRQTIAVPTKGADAFSPNVIALDMLEYLQLEGDVQADQSAELTSPDKVHICGSHPGKACVYICTTCWQGLCSTCMLPRNIGNHGNHEVEEIDAAFQKLDQALKACRALTANENKDIESKLQELDKIQKDAKAAIGMKANNACVKIIEEKDKAFDQIDDWHAISKKIISEQKNEELTRSINVAADEVPKKDFATLGTYKAIEQVIGQRKRKQFPQRNNLNVKVGKIHIDLSFSELSKHQTTLNASEAWGDSKQQPNYNAEWQTIDTLHSVHLADSWDDSKQQPNYNAERRTIDSLHSVPFADFTDVPVAQNTLNNRSQGDRAYPKHSRSPARVTSNEIQVRTMPALQSSTAIRKQSQRERLLPGSRERERSGMKTKMSSHPGNNFRSPAPTLSGQIGVRSKRDLVLGEARPPRRVAMQVIKPNYPEYDADTDALIPWDD